jgi:hypothetical protein
MCSSSTRNSHDDSDEVDGRQSSDESDESDVEDEIKRRINDTPITFEYVYGTASPAYHYKLPKSAESQNHAISMSATATMTSTMASSQSTGSSKKVKVNLKVGQSQAAGKKQHHHVQQSHKTEIEPAADVSDDEKSTDVENANQSLFLNVLKAIREFFYNRNNWSVTEESIIIWFGFMFFAIVVGCSLQPFFT